MGELVFHPNALYVLACELDAPSEEPPRETKNYQDHMRLARRIVTEVRDVGRKHPCHGALMSAVGASVVLRAMWESALSEGTPEVEEAIANLDRYLTTLRS
jgi:hypothetical protein